MSENRKLVRVTLDLSEAQGFLLERGEEVYPNLTDSEKAELQELLEELETEEVVEFNTAEDLVDGETLTTLRKRRRLNELKEKPNKPIVEWTPLSPNAIKSIVMVLRPDEINTYVENLPVEWINKLFQTTINLTGAAPTYDHHILNTKPGLNDPMEKNINLDLTPEERLQHELKGIEKEPTCGLDWVNMLEIIPSDKLPEGAETPEPDTDYLFIKASKWLGNDWSDARDAIERTFGKEKTVWVRSGQNSHWRVTLD